MTDGPKHMLISWPTRGIPSYW